MEESSKNEHSTIFNDMNVANDGADRLLTEHNITQKTAPLMEEQQKDSFVTASRPPSIINKPIAGPVPTGNRKTM